jgi:hypothetical protein
MLSQMKWIAAAALVCLMATAASAQTGFPPETHNAALRYWFAFAEMQDPPSDKATADLLEKTAVGETAWDEARLGSILDKNEAAILMMQRATNLPDCDWGLEYRQGARASIAYAPKARVLARLNTLYGIRLLSKGDTQKAVDTWLAGVRFSQHLAKQGGLIFPLIGRAMLLPNLYALTKAAQSDALNEAQRRQIELVVRAMPETGFDWSAAVRVEEAVLEAEIRRMAQTSNPYSYYEETMNYGTVKGRLTQENFTVPNEADIAALRKYMSSAAEALRLPPDAARGRLQTAESSRKTLHPYLQETAPSLSRTCEVRAEIQAARQKLLQAVTDSGRR